MCSTCFRDDNDAIAPAEAYQVRAPPVQYNLLPRIAGSNLDGMGTRHGTQRRKNLIPSSQNYAHRRRNSRNSLLSQVGCLEWSHTSQIHLEYLQLDSLRWYRISVLSLHACARSKQVLTQPQKPRDHRVWILAFTWTN